MAKAARGQLVTSMEGIAERAVIVTVLHYRDHDMALQEASGLTAAHAVHQRPVRLQASRLEQDGFAKLKAF